ncbi:hypothetical protein [Pelomonas sp. SE-A7]|uniref:pilus assembly PilX family protein n=1 Tax=Pelomonas sp. SE-A7 TaxID=3054953 RepID=UPI00259D06BA|nr:hypothetical protein [Pelomonas sp. SE-A7]MDM4767712.1 hypothetical protein [Pelomonas sp. SE-A7]
MSLLFALMGLVVLTLGAVALLRSVDTGLMVLGNLGFKQDALAASSLGTETAINWIQGSTTESLSKPQAAMGYSAVAMTALEPVGPRADANAGSKAVLIDWLDNGCQVPGLNGRAIEICSSPAHAPDLGNNKIRYFITRLCANEGLPDSTNDCVKPVVLSTTGTTTQRGSLGYGSNIRFTDLSPGTYFRIITRVEGVRGTVSYTETLVHF